MSAGSCKGRSTNERETIRVGAMIDIKFNVSDFERRAREIGAAVDQLPYALSLALNDAAFKARDELVTQTWPKSVKVRNRNFIRSALRVEKATKSNLTAAVFDSLGRAHLEKHAKGGVKQGRGKLAIPSSAVMRGASGVRQSQRPLNLKNKVVKGNLIFQRIGRGKNAKLRLMYKLAPSVKIKADVPFVQDFQRVMRREMEEAFPKAMAKAMATRRPR